MILIVVNAFTERLELTRHSIRKRRPELMPAFIFPRSCALRDDMLWTSLHCVLSCDAFCYVMHSIPLGIKPCGLTHWYACTVVFTSLERGLRRGCLGLPASGSDRDFLFSSSLAPREA